MSKKTGQSVIDRLIAPVDYEMFFRDHHERSAAIIHRSEPGRYLDLLTIDRIDALIAAQTFTIDTLSMTRADPPVSVADYAYDNDRIDRGAVARLYQQGATLILPQLHQTDAALADFCRAVESVFSCHAQTNVYLTPPDAQGFRTHYDDHDVFVLQVSGSKSWRLYDTPVENPYRGEGYRPGRHEIGEPVEEFVLHAGDCAYVPRGLMHDALTHGEAPSLHITLGLIVKTWADLMIESVSQVALHNPAFRRSLPSGFANPDYDRAEAEAYFKELVKIFGEQAQLDDCLDMFTDNFIRSRIPSVAGTIQNFNLAGAAGQAFMLKPGVPWRYAGDGDEVVIITAGGEVRFPASQDAVINRFLDGETLTPGTLSDLDETEAKNLLQKLHAYGLAEPVG